MPREIIVVLYDPQWKVLFQQIALPIREALGGIAKRIDHVGSTSIEGIAAKPVIDIQISVDDFEPFAPIQTALERLNYQWRSENVDKSKRYFREIDGARQQVHIHVRRYGSWSEQMSLLFRDYLRTHPDDRNRYGNLKIELAKKFRHDRAAYIQGKDALIWQILRRAHDWTWYEGWVAGESDV